MSPRHVGALTVTAGTVGAMTAPVTPIRWARTRPDAVAPRRAHPTDAGLDLAIPADEYVTVPAHETVVVDLGVAVEIPAGWVGLILPRSSVGIGGLRLANTTGVIDSDYRGSLRLVVRSDNGPQAFAPGERIAQLVIVPCLLVDAVEVDELPSTRRDAGGFGSTGR